MLKKFLDGEWVDMTAEEFLAFQAANAVVVHKDLNPVVEALVTKGVITKEDIENAKTTIESTK